MYNSDIAIYVKKVDYYEDMSKFAKLGLWIINSLGGEVESIEDLIGEYPILEVDRKLTDEDMEIIEMCKANNLKYKITNKGIKIST